MIVIVSKYEHHSNILPWREAKNVKIEVVSLDSDGGFDYGCLD